MRRMRCRNARKSASSPNNRRRSLPRLMTCSTLSGGKTRRGRGKATDPRPSAPASRGPLEVAGESDAHVRSVAAVPRSNRRPLDLSAELRGIADSAPLARDSCQRCQTPPLHLGLLGVSSGSGAWLRRADEDAVEQELERPVRLRAERDLRPEQDTPCRDRATPSPRPRRPRDSAVPTPIPSAASTCWRTTRPAARRQSTPPGRGACTGLLSNITSTSRSMPHATGLVLSTATRISEPGM